MKVEALEGALYARPFVPFRLVLPDGRSLPVPHPEFISISSNRKWVLVWDARKACDVIAPEQIVDFAKDSARHLGL